jgi:hypothetical protein
MATGERRRGGVVGRERGGNRKSREVKGREDGVRSTGDGGEGDRLAGGGKVQRCKSAYGLCKGKIVKEVGAWLRRALLR